MDNPLLVLSQEASRLGSTVLTAAKVLNANSLGSLSPIPGLA
ncbi:hypothetical protein C5S36_05175 [Candidatus Methanophagaceae archaeon]|nr:hypothetical protein C5S36_05175 [Methanophagales archaeon]